MATIPLPPDWKEFLQLLNAHQVEYLLVGGLAVSYYGYPRATGDIDLWVAVSRKSARKIVLVLEEFGFAETKLSQAMFLKKDRVIRMGNPPLRIELLTSISGVEFASCFRNRTVDLLDGVPVNIISLEELKAVDRKSPNAQLLHDYAVFFVNSRSLRWLSAASAHWPARPPEPAGAVPRQGLSCRGCPSGDSG